MSGRGLLAGVVPSWDARPGDGASGSVIWGRCGRRGVRPDRVLDPGPDLGLPHQPRVDRREGEPRPDRPRVPHPDRARTRRRHRRPPRQVPDRGRPHRNALSRPRRQHRRQDHRSPAPARPAPGRRGRLRPAGRHRRAAAVRLALRFAAAYERRAPRIASHWSFEDWGRSCPSTPPPPSRAREGVTGTSFERLVTENRKLRRVLRRWVLAGQGPSASCLASGPAWTTGR